MSIYGPDVLSGQDPDDRLDAGGLPTVLTEPPRLATLHKRRTGFQRPYELTHPAGQSLCTGECGIPVCCARTSPLRFHWSTICTDGVSLPITSKIFASPHLFSKSAVSPLIRYALAYNQRVVAGTAPAPREKCNLHA